MSVVWFKNTDLRLHDHLPLVNAHKSSDLVIHLMVMDNFWFRDKTRVLSLHKNGPYRCKFMKEAVLDLRSNLRNLGSELIIRFGSSSKIIPSIVSHDRAEADRNNEQPIEAECRFVLD